MRKISEGTSEFQSEIEEVNILVKELKRKYNEEYLREEVSHMNSPINTQEFIEFFCKKKKAQNILLVVAIWASTSCVLQTNI